MSRTNEQLYDDIGQHLVKNTDPNNALFVLSRVIATIIEMNWPDIKTRDQVHSWFTQETIATRGEKGHLIRAFQQLQNLDTTTTVAN